MMTDCGGKKISTDFEYNISSIEDLIPRKYNQMTVRIFDDNRLLENADEYKRGIYGSDISIEIWKFETAASSSAGYFRLTEEIDKKAMSDFNETISGQHLFLYTAKDKISGRIWSNKNWLFKIVAENNNLLEKFLLDTKLARLQ